MIASGMGLPEEQTAYAVVAAVTFITSILGAFVKDWLSMQFALKKSHIQMIEKSKYDKIIEACSQMLSTMSTNVMMLVEVEDIILEDKEPKLLVEQTDGFGKSLTGLVAPSMFLSELLKKEYMLFQNEAMSTLSSILKQYPTAQKPEKEVLLKKLRNIVMNHRKMFDKIGQYHVDVVNGIESK